MTDAGGGMETSNKQLLKELKNSKKFQSKKANIVFFAILSFIPIAAFFAFLQGIGLPGGIGLVGLVGILFGINAWVKEDKVKKAVRSKGLSHIDSELQAKAESYKQFFIVNLILWVLTIGVAVILPGMSGPRISYYDKECVKALNEIADAQKSYFSRKQTYTKEQKNLLGFTLPNQVKIEGLTADEKCWRASVYHDTGNDRRTFTYDSCKGGLVSEEPELSDKT